MRRRDFSAVWVARRSWPLAARATARARAAHRRAHVAGAADDAESQTRVAAFQQGLQQLGWTDRPQRARSTPAGPRPMPPTFADTRRELAALAPDVILAAQAPSSVAADCCRRPAAVPIVFVMVADPVGAGFVESLARPGGNATGFMHVRIQLEREMAGAAQRDRARRDASGGPSGSRHSPPGSGSSAPSRPWRRRSGWRLMPDQRARRRRDRARRRGICAHLRMAA